jgi:hypothetical protein
MMPFTILRQPKTKTGQIPQKMISIVKPLLFQDRFNEACRTTKPNGKLYSMKNTKDADYVKVKV